MKCHECGAPVEILRKDYPYVESGLPNIILRDLEIRRCKQCANEDIVIPRLEQLHRLIARELLAKKNRLAPPEVRFLRKHLGWSQEDFARTFGVRPETVSRWETGAERMSPPAERLLRLVVVQGDRIQAYSVEQLEGLDDKRNDELGVALRARGSTWEAELVEA